VEWLIGIAGVIGLILWAIWNSGKQSGIEEARQKERETNGRYERQISELEEERRVQRQEVRRLTAELDNIRTHLGALRGEALSVLDALRATKPPLVKQLEPFLLLAPGTLNSYAAWSRSASRVWAKIDQLSAQSRRALEEACHSHAHDDVPTAPREDGEANTPLFQETISLLRAKPSELAVNVFDLRTGDLEQLGHWFDQLSQLSYSYVMHVWQIEDRLKAEV